MAGKRQKKEPDVTGRIPGNVDLRGLTREEVLGEGRYFEAAYRTASAQEAPELK